MTILSKLQWTSLILIAAATLTSKPVEAAETPSRQDCFSVTEWHGWKSPNPDTLYLAVNIKDVYRVDLSAGSPQLNFPDRHLVSKVRGSDYICSALDLDLSISDNMGFKEPLIAKSITKLTPEEVAAIPAKYRP